MDAIAGLLDGPRARRAFLLRCTMDAPWALHIRDEAPLSLVAMLRGSACFVLDGRNSSLGSGVERALGRPPRDFVDYAHETARSGVWNSR